MHKSCSIWRFEQITFFLARAVVHGGARLKRHLHNCHVLRVEIASCCNQTKVFLDAWSTQYKHESITMEWHCNILQHIATYCNILQQYQQWHGSMLGWLQTRVKHCKALIGRNDKMTQFRPNARTIWQVLHHWHTKDVESLEDPVISALIEPHASHASHALCISMILYASLRILMHLYASLFVSMHYLSLSDLSSS